WIEATPEPPESIAFSWMVAGERCHVAEHAAQRTQEIVVAGGVASTSICCDWVGSTLPFDVPRPVFDPRRRADRKFPAVAGTLGRRLGPVGGVMNRCDRRIGVAGAQRDIEGGVLPLVATCCCARDGR